MMNVEHQQHRVTATSTTTFDDATTSLPLPFTSPPPPLRADPPPPFPRPLHHHHHLQTSRLNGTRAQTMATVVWAIDKFLFVFYLFLSIN
jgi:hypothetical protein